MKYYKWPGFFLGFANDSQANDNHAFDFSVSLGLSL